jgi:uncharacterized protein (DUF2461 family)
MADLSKNNNFEWFNANRQRYTASLVQPAKSFIIEMGDFFNRLNPSIRTAPKFNETIMRINKDMRFTKGDPYRDYFLIHFGKFKLDSEFYAYFDASSFAFGLFINNTPENENFYFTRNLNKYRKQFISITENYGIDNCFGLYDLSKNSKLITDSFSAKDHFDILPNYKMLLLQKSLSINDPIIFKPEITIELIKIYSVLYPVYCFAVSPQPLKLINEFEENFGIPELD